MKSGKLCGNHGLEPYCFGYPKPKIQQNTARFSLHITILENSISIYQVAEHNETRAQALREENKIPNEAKQKNLRFIRTFGDRKVPMSCKKGY